MNHYRIRTTDHGIPPTANDSDGESLDILPNEIKIVLPLLNYPENSVSSLRNVQPKNRNSSVKKMSLTRYEINCFTDSSYFLIDYSPS